MLFFQMYAALELLTRFSRKDRVNHLLLHNDGYYFQMTKNTTNYYRFRLYHWQREGVDTLNRLWKIKQRCRLFSKKKNEEDFVLQRLFSGEFSDERLYNRTIGTNHRPKPSKQFEHYGFSILNRKKIDNGWWPVWLKIKH